MRILYFNQQVGSSIAGIIDLFLKSQNFVVDSVYQDLEAMKRIVADRDIKLLIVELITGLSPVPFSSQYLIFNPKDANNQKEAEELKKECLSRLLLIEKIHILKPYLPVIVIIDRVVGLLLPEQYRALKEAKPDMVISMPVRGDELLEAILNLLKAGQMAVSAIN